VLDPTRRLDVNHRVFTQTTAQTLYICDRSLVRAGEHCFGCAVIVGVESASDGGVNLRETMRLLRARGCARVFIEGGGVTVSAFLAAGLLDRLHVAVAPLLIGDGRPAIRLPPRAALGECHRPRYRVFKMGGDILFDCDLSSEEPDGPARGDSPAIARVI
jgi:riboflavin biosynthesis pyrimidine reductase